MKELTDGPDQDHLIAENDPPRADRWLLRVRGPVQVEIVDQHGHRVGPYLEREEDEASRRLGWQRRLQKGNEANAAVRTGQPQELPHLFEVSIPGASYQPGHDFTSVFLTKPSTYTCRCRARTPCAVDIYWTAFHATNRLHTIHFQGVPLSQQSRAQWVYNTSDIYDLKAVAVVTPPLTLEEEGRTREIPPTAILNAQESQDTLAPKTTISIEDGKIVLSATDDGSGVSRTYYTTDGQTFSVYKEPFPLPPEARTVMAFSIDRNGNREYPGEVLPVLGLSETQLALTATVGDQKVGPHIVYVRNLDPLSVTGQLAWAASTDAPWLSIERTEGHTPDLLTLSANIGNLEPGIHKGDVNIRSSTPRTVYAERVVSVVLEVKPG